MQAARHAVIVGISAYEAVPKLPGPIHDVAAMESVIQTHWDFPAENTVKLLNEQATRKNILSALKNLEKTGKADDQFFIYLSGHGTSASDPDLSPDLPANSGAFLPYDITKVKTLEELKEKLIIGKRDLRPIFEKLDQQGKHVFVVVDACYSGNTVRGRPKGRAALPVRFVSADQMLTRSIGRTDGVKQKEIIDPSEPYPYTNIYYLAASGENEPAQDIPAEMLERYPTFDGNPHGAFTDSFLQFMNFAYSSDINNDAQISYKELKESVRRFMQARGFSHIPQSLPPLEEDKNNLAASPVFGSSTPKISARLSNTQMFQQQQLAITPVSTIPLANSSVTVVGETGASDLRIEQENNEYQLLNSSGDLVSTAQTKTQLAETIDAQVDLHQLINAPMQQDFSLELKMLGMAKGSTAMEGEHVGFAVRASKESYLLLMNIDSHGNFTVLYPYTLAELNPIARNQVIKLEAIGTVQAPFGRDHVIAYAFDKKVPELEILTGQKFNTHSPFMTFFNRLLSNGSLGKARSSLDLYTVARSPIY